ncbi:short transient receptor potential channel 3-like [Uloborus diversus]|uniref:short transient receptor potential channel 3-like n=1 Tax=Uloborus diversus TaxID=327109 RepID=UPI002409B3FB|nr:short transient receptor potential channel 3-like [Uloborus diversus]
MSRENLMARRSASTSNVGPQQGWGPPPPPPPPSGGPPPPSVIVELEDRRGSLPLAQLKEEEEEFFQEVESGDVRKVERFLNEHRNLNINCINYKGQNALQIAIKKENEDMVKFLFRRPDLEVRDAALYAITTGNIDLTTIILDYIKSSSPENEMLGCQDSPNYSPDITPLILAAQCGDYKIVRLLLERNHVIEKPHLPSCLCPTCKIMIEQMGSALSRMRLNAYKAISNPAYICQISDDPIYYGFGLDRELKQCGLLDKEFREFSPSLHGSCVGKVILPSQETRFGFCTWKLGCRPSSLYAEYEALAQEVRNFTVTILAMCRDISEIEILLKLDWGYEGSLEKIPFPRLQLALDYYQKEFVAHSMVQTILTSYWLGEFRSWPRLSLTEKSLRVLVRVIFLPFICIALLFIPQIKILRKWRAPLNRYLMWLSSYIFFVFCVYWLNYLDTGKAARGPPRTDAKRDIIHQRKNIEKKFWPHSDATLLHEGFFAIATILSFGKLAYYCLQSSRLGPLQVSMGKMAIQISYFLIVCFLIITSFAVPMARMYAYYSSPFNSFSDAFTTFFWAMFCMSDVESPDIVKSNSAKDKNGPVINSHVFTEGVGRTLFATFHLMMVIALLNTLIAILSNTFQNVVQHLFYMMVIRCYFFGFPGDQLHYIQWQQAKQMSDPIFLGNFSSLCLSLEDHQI